MTNVGHIQELAIVEVVERDRDVNGILHPIPFSVVRSLKISPSFGPVWYTDLDWGFPNIDEVMTPFSNSSGMFDETRFHRDRAVSLSVTVLDDWFPDTGAQLWPQEWNNSSFWVRELGRWVVPSGRFRLYWRNTGADNSTFWCNLRGSGLTSGITSAQRETREVQLNWICPDGKIYLFDATYDPNDEPNPRATKDGRTRTVVSYGGALNPGVSVPLTFPFAFPAGLSTNSGVDYSGTISTGAVFRIWGGAADDTVDPVMTVTSPDGTVQTVAFSGLTVPANQYVEIDTNRMTVLMNGIPSQRRESTLTAPLQFPQLQPGFNAIALNADSAGDDSYIETLHFTAFLAG